MVKNRPEPGLTFDAARLVKETWLELKDFIENPEKVETLTEFGILL
jgi:hypothetical protein